MFARFLCGFPELRANQVECVNLIVDHLTEHGVMDPALLYYGRRCWRCLDGIPDEPDPRAFHRADDPKLLSKGPTVERAVLCSLRRPQRSESRLLLTVYNSTASS
jgi:hypothetical protein